MEVGKSVGYTLWKEVSEVKFQSGFLVEEVIHALISFKCKLAIRDTIWGIVNDTLWYPLRIKTKPRL
jgi:hypothetical protein